MTAVPSPAFRANLADLRNALDRIAPAAPARPPHPILGAVVVDVGDDGAVRLSAFDLLETVSAGPLPGGDGQDVELLFPRGPFVALAKQIPAGEITVEVDGTGSTVRVGGGGTVATARLLEDVQFPRFRALLPAGSPHIVTVDGQRLSKVVTKAAGLGDRTGVVSVTGDGAAVRVAPYSGDRPDGGVRGAAVPAGGDTDGLLFCVNGGYLAEALKTFGGDVAIGVQQLARSTRPILLAGSAEGLSSGAEYRHLLMPCRMAQ